MRVIIIGCGSLGRVAHDVLQRLGQDEVVGFADDAAPAGRLVLGRSDELKLLAERMRIDAAVVAVGRGDLRRTLAARARQAGLQLPAVVSRSAVVSPSAEIGEGALVMPMVVVGPDVKIGELAVVCAASAIEHDAVLEEACCVGPRCLIDARAVVAAGSRVPGGAVVPQDARFEEGQHYA